MLQSARAQSPQMFGLHELKSFDSMAQRVALLYHCRLLKPFARMEWERCAIACGLHSKNDSLRFGIQWAMSNSAFQLWLISIAACLSLKLLHSYLDRFCFPRFYSHALPKWYMHLRNKKAIALCHRWLSCQVRLWNLLSPEECGVVMDFFIENKVRTKLLYACNKLGHSPCSTQLSKCSMPSNAALQQIRPLCCLSCSKLWDDVSCRKAASPRHWSSPDLSVERCAPPTYSPAELLA